MTRSGIKKLLALLDEHYPDDTKCYLDYNEPWQLLVATILSAQCTDARVNMLTPALFGKYKNVKALAEAGFDELCEDIRPAGFYRVKAGNILSAMRIIADEHGGEVPRDMESLTRLPGVGRKTANVVLGHVYGIPSVVVDTHVMRVSYRLGLTNSKNPDKIERDLMEILPKDHWIRFNTQIIAHGRSVCRARGARCGICPLAECCENVSVSL